MALVRASQVFEGAVEEAETVWYDTARWPRWIVGLACVESVTGGWFPGGRTYQLKRRSPLMRLVDVLFIRGS